MTSQPPCDVEKPPRAPTYTQTVGRAGQVGKGGRSGKSRWSVPDPPGSSALSTARGTKSLALGPHPQRELTLIPPLGFPWPRNVAVCPTGQAEALVDHRRVVPANLVVRLANRREVRDVFLDAIQGRSPRPHARSRRWFCVWGVVAIQIEGRIRGSLSLEDRLVVVKARDPEDAKSRLERMWTHYAEPYLNTDGFLVRWQVHRGRRPCRRRGESPLAKSRSHAAGPLSHLGPAADFGAPRRFPD